MDRIYCPCEFKSDGDEDGTIQGYGSVFGNVDSYGDTVAKGAFAKTIADARNGNGPWPAMLLEHGGQNQSDLPIGIWTEANEDSRGLKLKGKLAIRTERGADAYALLKMKPRPALNGLSIGYRAKEFELHKNNSGPNGAKWTLKSVDLVECSLVTFPADQFARVGSVKSWLEEPVDEAVRRKAWATDEFEKMRRLMNRSGR
jgi:Escherichia/Staphylococcus phage prohead protease